MQVESKFFQLMRKFILLIIGISLLHGCQFFEKRKTDGVVAEYNGKTLTTRELDALTANLSGEDSARVAQAYIKQWAIEVIEYDIAKDQINNDIEQLVEDYRRSLYLHEYENKLIAQRMPTEIEDTLVQSFYEFHKEHLILPETILRGVLVVVPSDAPNMDDLRTNIQQPEVEENIEWLEKFAYQYATGYELFLEDWKSLSEIIVYMPFEQSNLEKELKKNRPNRIARFDPYLSLAGNGYTPTRYADADDIRKKRNRTSFAAPTSSGVYTARTRSVV